MLLAGALVSAIALPQISSAFDGSGHQILLAQKEDPKKKKEQPKTQPKPNPQQTQPKPVPKQDPKTVQPKPTLKQDPKTVQPKTTPKQDPKTVQPKTKQDPKTVQPKLAPKQDPKTVQPKTKQDPKTVQPTLTPKQDPKTVQPKTKQDPKTVQPKLAPKQDPKTVQPKTKQDPKTVQPTLTPKQDPKTVQPKTLPKQDPKTVQPKTKQDPKALTKFGKPKPAPGPQVTSVKEIKSKREVIKEKDHTIIVEPGNRRIIRDNKNRVVIIHDDAARLRRFGDSRFEVRGQERYTIVRRGGYEIVTVTDSRGHLIRRFRRGSDGREYVLIDNRRRGVGAGAAVLGIVALGLLAPRITIPRERYIVDARAAPPDLLFEALDAPPVEPLERAYTFDEIRDNVELRDRVRSIDINTINFETGSWEIGPDQYPQLQAIAEAMLKVIEENSDSVFLLEGHTDAVGPPEDNLSLSDRRAESVAEILTSEFQVPPENLMTQGYGEQHLRVQTDGPSRENRRVQVRNITHLLAGK